MAAYYEDTLLSDCPCDYSEIFNDNHCFQTILKRYLEDNEYRCFWGIIRKIANDNIKGKDPINPDDVVSKFAFSLIRGKDEFVRRLLLENKNIKVLIGYVKKVIESLISDEQRKKENNIEKDFIENFPYNMLNSSMPQVEDWVATKDFILTVRKEIITIIRDEKRTPYMELVVDDLIKEYFGDYYVDKGDGQNELNKIDDAYRAKLIERLKIMLCKKKQIFNERGLSFFYERLREFCELYEIANLFHFYLVKKRVLENLNVSITPRMLFNLLVNFKLVGEGINAGQLRIRYLISNKELSLERKRDVIRLILKVFCCEFEDKMRNSLSEDIAKLMLGRCNRLYEKGY